MRTGVCFAICLAVGVMGCGESGPPKAELHPVSGKVTVKGKPLTGCSVVFSITEPVPGASGGYSGELDANGNFTLSDSSDGSVGAAVGKYKVTFLLPPESAEKAMMKGGTDDAEPGYETVSAPFPKEYGSVETSPKEVEVKAETNVINIEI